MDNRQVFNVVQQMQVKYCIDVCGVNEKECISLEEPYCRYCDVCEAVTQLKKALAPNGVEWDKNGAVDTETGEIFCKFEDREQMEKVPAKRKY